jgi:L-lactate dehydrogenase complex protein LldF
VCPVYERVGGHAYGSVYPGPIGAVLSPQLTGIEANRSLPFASTLCGACYDVCPVKINIPEVLVHLRQSSVDSKRGRPSGERTAMRVLAWTMRDKRRYARALRAARAASRPLRGRAIRHLPWPMSAWTSSRDAPVPAKETFREWWARR